MALAVAATLIGPGAGLWSSIVLIAIGGGLAAHTTSADDANALELVSQCTAL
jgi:hypothetical protein